MPNEQEIAKNAKKTLVEASSKVSEKDIDQILNKRDEFEKKFSGNGPIGKLMADCQLLFSMIQDYRSGVYRDIPWSTIAAAVAALAYVICPVDMIPDVIPVLGQVDDAAVVAFCLVLIRSDLQSYKEWKLKTIEKA